MTSHVFIPLCVVRCLRCCSQGDRRCECANQNKSHHVLSVERLPRCLRAQKTVCIMSYEDEGFRGSPPHARVIARTTTRSHKTVFLTFPASTADREQIN